MYEIVQVGERTYYIDCPSKVGIYKLNEKEIVLIDSGSSRDAARKMLRAIEHEGWEVKTIINTHLHPDHVSGNKYFANNTGCNILATKEEKVFIENPHYFALFFFLGSMPKSLSKAFYIAKESQVEVLTEENLPEGLEIRVIKGHSVEQIAIMTSDKVWFLGDGVFGKETLSKYHVSYLYDLGDFLRSLDIIGSMEGQVFIPSHGPVIENISEVARLNREKVMETVSHILKICKEPTSLEGVVKGIFKKYELIHNLEQHYLIQATLNAYMAYLLEEGKVEVILEEYEMKWRTRESLQE